MLVLANPGAVQGKTIAEALPAIRKKPEDFRFGLSALGAANHLAVLEFNKLTGLDLQIIPYRGSAPALTDLISGQVQLMIDPIITALPLVQGGQLRALAVASAKRSSVLPELPTAAESGLAGPRVLLLVRLLGAEEPAEGHCRARQRRPDRRRCASLPSSKS